MIFPVPVTLNRFLALEFVFTFGIVDAFNFYTRRAVLTGEHLWSRLGNQEAGIIPVS